MNKKSQEKPINANNIDSAFDKENILNLLDVLNMGTFGSNNIIKEKSHNPVNKSILIETPNNGCVGENQILVNAKQGQPTVDQVYNAIYQHGADCQKQIIAFTGGNFLDDKFNPSADVAILKCLIDNMNRKATLFYKPIADLAGACWREKRQTLIILFPQQPSSRTKGSAPV